MKSDRKESHRFLEVTSTRDPPKEMGCEGRNIKSYRPGKSSISLCAPYASSVREKVSPRS